MPVDRVITAASLDELNRRSNDLQALTMELNERSDLTDEKRAEIDRLVDEVQSIPAEEAGLIGEGRGLYVRPPHPLTPLEQAYLRGEVGKLYTPNQYRRLQHRQRLLAPVRRLIRAREARPSRSRRTRAASAHGPPGRLDDPDEPEPPRGWLRAFLSRKRGRNR